MNSKTILIADDDRDLVTAMESRCQAEGFQVLTAYDALSALNLTHQERPDVVCMDLEMPGGNGLSVCEMLATDKQVSSIPVIILTGHKETDIVDHCRYLKATYVPKDGNVWENLKTALYERLGLETPPTVVPHSESSEEFGSLRQGVDVQPDASNLVDHVFALLEAHDAMLDEKDRAAGSISSDEMGRGSRPWLLFIEDDGDFSLALKLKLEQHGIGVVRAFEGLEGVQDAITRPADAILLDYHLPNGKGDFVLRRLKRNPITRDIPVIVLTGVNDEKLRRQMLSLGASAFLTKPLDFQQLLAELLPHLGSVCPA